MFVKDIVEIVENVLYAIHFDPETENEFDILYQQWTNPLYLYHFFEENEQYLKDDFYKISIQEAIRQTKKDVESLMSLLIETAENNQTALQTLIFKPLHKTDISLKYIEVKAKGQEKKSWLRIYAIELAQNLYIITGGGIKLTKTMNEDKLLEEELQKLKIVKQFLKNQDIIDVDDISDFKKDAHED